MLLEPIEKEINGKLFIISKFPAIAGREIAAIYLNEDPVNGSNYKKSEEIMLKLMCFVAIPMEGREPLRLMTRELVDNHTRNWQTLVKLEKEMIEYNCAPLEVGRA